MLNHYIWFNSNKYILLSREKKNYNNANLTLQQHFMQLSRGNKIEYLFMQKEFAPEFSITIIKFN